MDGVMAMQARAEVKAAEDPHYALGRQYFTGQGMALNLAQALKCFLRAAERGHAPAQYAAAVMAARGQGAERNATLAAHWLRKAALQGHAGAQYGLGDLYRSGDGVPLDVVAAAEWYRRAADQGHAKARDHLARLKAEAQAKVRGAATPPARAGSRLASGS